jgi:amidase
LGKVITIDLYTLLHSGKLLWSTATQGDQKFRHNGIYLLLFNLSEHPAVVIRIGQTPAGLPIEMQIVGI